MKQERHTPELEVVLDAYATETSTSDPQELAKWMREYPQYACELMDFAAARSLSERLSSAGGPEEDEEALVARGLAVLDEILGAPAAQRTQSGPLNDLVAAARERGMTVADLADAIGLSVPLVAKLQRRLLRLASIPHQLVEDLARILRYSSEAVANYLGQSPSLAAGAHYRSDRAPTLNEQQDFLDAVRSDPSITPENRGRWISLAQHHQEA